MVLSPSDPAAIREPGLGTAMGRDMELLLKSLQYCVDGTGAEAIRALAKNGVDWDFLAVLARHHGVTPPLFRALEAACPDLVPAPQLQQLSQYFKITATRNLVLTGELLRLVRLLRSNDIPAVPFKGPVLSMLLFGDASFREFSDLDILVRVADVVKARDVLLAHGYSAKHLMEQFELYTRFGHELDMVHGERQIALDLQWRFASNWIAFPIDFDDFWRRLQTHSIGGEQVLQPALDDMLLVLCGHGYRHFWEQLKWIVDIAAFMHVFGAEIPWAATLERATRLGGRRLILLGLHLARQAIGTQLPIEVKNAIESDPNIEALGAEVLTRMATESRARKRSIGAAPFLNKLQFHFKARERWRDKMPHPRAYGQYLLYWAGRYRRHYSRQWSSAAGTKH